MTKSPAPLIMGFDILPQSSPSSLRSPLYAMALKKGDVIRTWDALRRNELISMIRQEKPDIVATDNILELAPTEKGVIDLLSKIPSKTRIVQITGSPLHGMTPLTKLAKKHGFRVHSHPTPVETASLITELTAQGIGTEISVLARETRITISRARNIGPGGFSQARYQRRMHGAIQQVARRVLEKLSKKGMDYDQFDTKTSHGLSRCVIHVYDSLENVCQIIQSEVNRIAGVSIQINPVKHRSILYLVRGDRKEQQSPRRLLVVGIDAGTTIGIAIADINGNLLALRSGRGLSRGDVIRYLVDFGRPILIATDVAPAPNFVEKLSASLQTHLFFPDRLISVAEKRELAKTFDLESKLRPTNSHQRDALAAISKVFQIHGNKFKLLNKRLKESEHHHLVSKVVSLMLQGVSLTDALNQSILPLDTETLKTEITDQSQRIPATPSKDELLHLIKRLERQVESLQRQLHYESSKHRQSLETLVQSKNELEQTQRKLERIQDREQREQRLDERISRKDAQIQRLKDQIKLQRNELEKTKRTLTNLKLMRRLEIRGEVQPILVLPQFSQDEIRRFAERYPKKKGMVIYILNPSGGGSSTAEQLIQLGVQVVITHGTMSHLALEQFHSVKIPVLNAESLEITSVDEFAVVDANQLGKELAKWEKKYLTTEREATAEALERIIQEYRQERRNGTS